VLHSGIHVGIAVAIDDGLLVPVIRHADRKPLRDLARIIQDFSTRARDRKLTPDEVQGGTFTLTNPGIFGGLYGIPIINQPQVAILATGGIEKRPVVVDDAIAIRPMVYMALSFDHRIIDGAVADQFMADVKSDLAGLSQPGEPKGKIKERIDSLKLDIAFEACPVVFWDAFGQQGHPVRTTISAKGKSPCR